MYLGFRVNEGEYKVMGLAPYGEPRYVDQVRELVQTGPGGKYTLAMAFFDFVQGRRMFSSLLCDRFGAPPREPGSEIKPFHCDVAKSLQLILEEMLLGKVCYLAGEGAAASAQAMIALDGATCPSSWRLLAQAHQGAGDGEQAREACRAEVDSNQYATLCFLSAPQATMMAQGLQRRAARHPGFATVDLPQIFAEYTGVSLPGRRLFLDSCHLTVEGMKVAAVTAEALRIFGDDEPGWQTLARRLPDPPITPEADATARFGAAIHSAHRLLTVGSKAPLLENWRHESLRASPGVEQAMVDFVSRFSQGNKGCARQEVSLFLFEVSYLTPMLRSLVFCHAIWAGIAAYFIAVASGDGGR